MVFSSTTFIFVFLPLVLSGYYLLPDFFKNIWLFLVSLLFFGWSQPGYVWLILLSISMNYIIAILIDNTTRLKKLVLAIGVIANLSILFYFKYFNFAAETINQFWDTDFVYKTIILPIGISFFTFQGISYIVDVYTGNAERQNNIIKAGLYIDLFPQLIAGPIVRYKSISAEIENRKTTLDDFCSGIERFIIGLSKKAIIANTMAEAVDAIWNNGAVHSSCAAVWIGSIAYTLQIYYDFSGYSDMAIGLGRMFGFHFCENFNLPYISYSISEFWRRWHISLSSWFKDYVYIPLGGNKKHVYLNLTVVFLLTGLWHGASWHFVFWGAWNGVFVLLERFLREHISHFKDSIGTLWMKGYTLFIVNIGWVLFRAPDTKDALNYLGVMFHILVPNNIGFSFFWYFNRWTTTILIIGILFASSVPSKFLKKIRALLPDKALSAGKYMLLIILFYLALIRIVSGTYNPFIYFQF